MAAPSTYADCVSSLTHSLTFLTSSVATLRDSTADLPRLSTALRTTRHYELIPHPSLAAAEASLRDEIGPHIAHLLDRAETQVDRAERRVETLKARSELLAGRMAADDRGGGGGGSSTGGPIRARTPGARGKGLAARGRSRRGRLELQVSQKERELRKRLEEA
ncbi:conserved hypothetical protein [Verticillium alfalfae VaMs.102]|uniref:DASH complex subunit SPC19 n=1 Tax=Verticillium alfalfae (strain VaMs.102 / ATCC MYA-4576 / FGSC 10136) TaxID=526221 RepID=C9SA06_VERA1|nr:conserved hypothetical protein [Verticillium alfalfae VaMs.102]EEY16219.1 conserved hypothetical protein [Verticillium alfalfae VaMs.102]